LKKLKTAVKRLLRSQSHNVTKMVKKNAALEKKIIKIKIRELHAKIKRNRFWVPEVGDLVYTPTRGYIDHGEDDIRGGLATVKQVKLNLGAKGRYVLKTNGEVNKTAGNDIFIFVQEVPDGFNWGLHFEDQKEYMEEYGTEFARPDPDYNSYGPWDS
jgi:hypothetical protein